MTAARGRKDLVLIDLDASRAVGGVLGNDKLSTAYAPPEALQRPPVPAPPPAEALCPACQAPLPPPTPLWCNELAAGARAAGDSSLGPGIVAEKTFDAWGLGATLYYLVARKALFACDVGDALAERRAGALALQGWDLEQLQANAGRGVARRVGPDERFIDLAPDLLEGVTGEQLRLAFLKAVEPKLDLRPSRA
jgi:hypothetical protein